MNTTSTSTRTVWDVYDANGVLDGHDLTRAYAVRRAESIGGVAVARAVTITAARREAIRRYKGGLS